MHDLSVELKHDIIKPMNVLCMNFPNEVHYIAMDVYERVYIKFMTSDYFRYPFKIAFFFQHDAMIKCLIKYLRYFVCCLKVSVD